MRVFVLIAIVGLLVACSGDKSSGPGNVSADVLDGIDPCTLITLADAAELVGQEAAHMMGGRQMLNSRVTSCSVDKKNNMPQVIIQVLAGVEGFDNMIGSDHDLTELKGTSQPMAMIYSKEDKEYNIARRLSMLAIKSKGLMLTISPTFLEIEEGSDEYDQLIALGEKAVKALRKQQ